MATTKTVEERVKNIFVEQLGVIPDQLTPNALIVADLHADSLDVIELAMAAEEEFNIEIPDEELEKIRTVDDAIKYIQKHLA